MEPCATSRCTRGKHKGASHRSEDGLWFGGDEWETPPGLYRRLEHLCGEITGFYFCVDVCASHKNAKCGPFYSLDDMDALQTRASDWLEHGGPCWMNPPYSDPAPWLERAHEVQKIGGVVFALVPAALETRYFAEHVHGVADTVLMLSRRVKFVGAKASAKGPNVVVIYRGHIGETRWVPFEITPEEAGYGKGDRPCSTD